MTRTIMNGHKATQLVMECKAFFNLVPFGTASMEPGRIISSCNLAYMQMLGVAPGEIIGYLAPLPESEKERWEAQESGLRAGHPIADYEGPRQRKDESQFPATIFASPTFDEHGMTDEWRSLAARTRRPCSELLQVGGRRKVANCQPRGLVGT
jgi:PAS domain-containing protein